MTDLKVVKDPHFKSDFNIDLLRSVNYICHFLVVSRELIEKVGSFRKEYDGAQDYDFILRCVEVLKEEEIYHIPKKFYIIGACTQVQPLRIHKASYMLLKQAKELFNHIWTVFIFQGQ